jgi:hypothetical protein
VGHWGKGRNREYHVRWTTGEVTAEPRTVFTDRGTWQNYDAKVIRLGLEETQLDPVTVP